MNYCYFETAFLIEDIDAPKVFEYVSSFLCGQVTYSGEVNLAAQCDQEWYLIHEKIPMVRNTTLFVFKISLGTLIISSVTLMGFFLVFFSS